MVEKRLEWLIGPRVAPAVLARGRMQFLLPTLLLILSGLLLVISIFFPYWQLEVATPGHPQPLRLDAYLNHVEGDVEEIEAIDPPLAIRPTEAVRLERSLSIALVVTISLLVAAAVLIHNRLAALLSLPAILYPIVYLADLSTWLSEIAASRPAAVAPVLFGSMAADDLSTLSGAGAGLVLAFCSSLLVVTGLFLHRRAYKPLIDSSDSDPSPLLT